MRCSKNHRTNDWLPGWSVVKGPWFYLLRRPYCWFVAGRELEQCGPDGEPLLDVHSLAVIAEPMTRRKLLDLFHDGNRARLLALSKETGVSQVELFALLIGLH